MMFRLDHTFGNQSGESGVDAKSGSRASEKEAELSVASLRNVRITLDEISEMPIGALLSVSDSDSRRSLNL